MNNEPDWSLYRTLLAVLDDGSLSGAARRLGLTQPTVARHIDALEAALGGDLFVRSQRGLSPTDLALSLRPMPRRSPRPPRRCCGRPAARPERSQAQCGLARAR